MKKSLIMVMLICVTIMMPGCAIFGLTPAPTITIQPNAATAEYRKISAEEARAMMDAEHTLLDARTDEEFAEGHIAGAVLIPDNEITARAQTELPDKDALILIYCRSGRRSTLAANELVAQGYTNVYDFGGIIDSPYDMIVGE